MQNSPRIVKLMPKAESDLDDIFEYLCGFSFDIGYKYFNLILDELFKLEENADIYPYVRDEQLKLEKVKWMAINNYIVFFTIHNERETMLVRRILYAKRYYSDLV